MAYLGHCVHDCSSSWAPFEGVFCKTIPRKVPELIRETDLSFALCSKAFLCNNAATKTLSEPYRKRGSFLSASAAVDVHALVPLTRVLELQKTAKTERDLAGEVGNVGGGV